jgi:LPS-assembly protein
VHTLFQVKTHQKITVKNLPITLGILLICLNYGIACAEEVEIGPTPAADASTDNVAPGVVVIEGDRLQVHLDRDYKSIGDAALHRGNQDVYGDSIEYNTENDELHVVGNARVETPDINVWGEELHLNLGENTGEM